MESIGLRELRQQASELVRRAQDGEVMVVTVSGRPAAQLGPVARSTWRDASELAELFDGPPDQSWERDREFLDDEIRDPWGTL